MCRGQTPKVIGEMVARPSHLTPCKLPPSKMWRGAYDVKGEYFGSCEMKLIVYILMGIIEQERGKSRTQWLQEGNCWVCERGRDPVQDSENSLDRVPIRKIGYTEYVGIVVGILVDIKRMWKFFPELSCFFFWIRDRVFSWKWGGRKRFGRFEVRRDKSRLREWEKELMTEL